MVLCWIALVISLLTLAVWAVVGWRLNRALGTGLGIQQHHDDEIDEEMVSIIVPAHNEARIIDRCVRSLMAQNWPNLEIIFVADRCTDETVSILREASRGDDRVRIIENHDCPDSWAGKCNAARLGAAGACGRYLIFMDADTFSAPELIRSAVNSARAKQSSMLSLLSKLTTDAIYERRTQTVASMLLLTLYPPDRVNRETDSRPFANGQFMLFDREWYEKIGGHEAVRDDLLEDIAFARRVESEGGRVHLRSSDGMLVCSMYSSSTAFRRGWQRIFIESCRRKPDRMKRWAFRMRLLGLMGPLGCLLGIGVGAVTWSLGEPASGLTVLIVSMLALLTQLGVLAAIYRTFNQTPWDVWRFPLGCEDLARILRDGAKVLQRGEPVTWGGRSYILEAR